MSGGIDKIQLIGFAIAVLVVQGHTLGLDGNAPLPLQIHGVQYLGFHLSIGQTTAALNKAIGQGGLTVVDMGDDREVANVLVVCHAACTLDWRGRSLAHTGPAI